MKRSLYFAPVAALLLSCLPASAGPSIRSYQVTGPIVALTDTIITVQKGSERWEIARTPETKVSGELKVGGKVTIAYTMVAGKVDAK